MFFIFTQKVDASVIISEIAWMGTSESSSNEWIELYNNGDDSVDLSEWFLETEDQDISIELLGSIIPNGYYLIERTDDTTVPNFTADLIASFGHGLSNSGETLFLKNSSNSNIQTLSFASGWTAGDSTTKETMQWNGSKWITAFNTPKDGSMANSNSNIQDETDTTVNNVGDTITTSTSSKEETKVYDISTKIIFPKIVTAGVPFIIDHLTTGKKKEKIILGKFVWNFGDGMTREGYKSDPFTYIYQYSGDYVLNLSFYESMLNTKPDATDRLIVKVIPSGVSIISVGTYTDPYVELENNSNYEMLLNDFILKGYIHSFVIPNGMTILSKGKLKLSPKITGFDFNDLNSITISDSSGQIFATYPKQNIPAPKYSTNKVFNEGFVKSEVIEDSKTVDSEKVINLNDLSASAENGGVSVSNKYLIYIGLIAIIFLGIFSIISFRRKKEMPDYVEGGLSAKDMTLIE